MNTSELVLSEDQQSALERISAWVDSRGDGFDDEELSLGGLAGTGKTTLVSLLLERGPVVLAPTAKACSVLRRKGVMANTIHSAIFKYEGVDTSGQRPVLDFSEKGSSFEKLVIVDEASMVTAPVANALRRAVCARGGKLLWVGDHGQLPPVGEDPRILAAPDIRLERIHRQAADSPILQVASAARKGTRLIEAASMFTQAGAVRAVNCPSLLHLEELMATSKPDVVLVARNDTRRAVNKLGWKLNRPQIGMEDDDYPHPFSNAPVVALRNGHRAGIVNGEQYLLESFNIGQVRSDDEFVEASLLDYLGGRTAVTFWNPALGEGTDRQMQASSTVEYDVAMLDYAWALTVHKAQGSEFPHVLVVDETVTSKSGWDHARWSYTAATRAKDQLTVVRLGR